VVIVVVCVRAIVVIGDALFVIVSLLLLVIGLQWLQTQVILHSWLPRLRSTVTTRSCTPRFTYRPCHWIALVWIAHTGWLACSCWTTFLIVQLLSMAVSVSRTRNRVAILGSDGGRYAHSRCAARAPPARAMRRAAT